MNIPLAPFTDDDNDDDDVVVDGDVVDAVVVDAVVVVVVVIVVFRDIAVKDSCKSSPPMKIKSFAGSSALLLKSSIKSTVCMMHNLLDTHNDVSAIYIPPGNVCVSIIVTKRKFGYVSQQYIDFNLATVKGEV